jgi:uncharacterized protein YcbK (DUF882 family)
MAPGRVGRHFHVAEFDCNDGTPVPPAAGRELAELVAELLDPLRVRFGVTNVLSGYRTDAHNRAVGGAPKSFHLYRLKPGRGVAADVRCARGTPTEWAAFLAGLGAGGIGTYHDWVHVDTRRGTARWRG